jgi:hypothetical protein
MQDLVKKFYAYYKTPKFITEGYILDVKVYKFKQA